MIHGGTGRGVLCDGVCRARESCDCEMTYLQWDLGGRKMLSDAMVVSDVMFWDEGLYRA